MTIARKLTYGFALPLVILAVIVALAFWSIAYI